jgi:anthranilate synthase/aminodeoxychorismate synthase-like glutamine amidotransferase
MDPRSVSYSGVSVSPVDLGASLAELYPILTRRRQGSGLLETLGPDGPSVLAWDPAVTVHLGPLSVLVRSDPRVALGGVPRTRAQVPAFLDRLVGRFRVERPEDGSVVPAFLGGLLGFVGYEWAASQEGPDSARLSGFPDMWFGLFDRAVVRTPGGASQVIVVPSIRGADPAATRRQVVSASAHAHAIRGAALSVQRFTTSWTRADFEGAVREVRRRIRLGEVYQVNLALQLRALGIDPWQLYLDLRERNPSPFAGFLEGGGVALASASPERVLRVSGTSAGPRSVETRPIAGTRPRDSGARDALNERALRRSPKERAEHTMLVDLSRNDLGRVCSLGTVEVDEWLTVERYSHVMHLVSNVRGCLPPHVGIPKLFQALLPGGSVTGTPKIRATEIIAELEPVPRGPFTGSMGYVSLDGQMDFNLLIRSAFFPRSGGEALVCAGAGIVQDSRPEREWKEVQAKAAVLLEAASGTPSRGFGWSPPRRYASWKPPAPSHHHARRNVLLIDNYDSFTYNLAQYLSMLGARVRVARNDAEALGTLRSWNPTHVVLSPGPGRPEESGVTVPAVRAFEGTPLLGVCLGHQAIVEAYGGSIGTARLPIHGKSSTIHCVGGAGGVGILQDLAPSFQAARYHSLVARTVPDELRVTATTADGEVMAVQHREFPTYGVQFHPESLRTERGMTILDRFLGEETRHG